MGKQLYEKVNGEYVPIFSKNLLENIKESEDGRTLAEVLTNFNSIYLPYTNSVAETRNLIPDYMRRKGLSICYNIGDDTITEYYKGRKEDIAEHWSDNNNWEVIPDLDFVRQEAAKLPDGIVTPDKLSPALQELIKQNNSIVNLPDDEDLEERNGVMSLKERKYNPYIASGKGYKILRKNWVKGRNILTQDMISDSNTIYEIRYDYDLDDKEIIIPEGCVLNFIGGSFKKGIINFQYTFLKGEINILCDLKGHIKNNDIKVNWFDKDIVDFYNVFKQLSNILENQKLIFDNKNYNISFTKNKDSCMLLNKNNIELCGNGATIIVNSNDYPQYNVIDIIDSNNFNIHDLNIIGDRLSHNYTVTGNTHEFGYGIFIRTNYTEETLNKPINGRIYNCDISQMTGDAIILKNGLVDGKINIDYCNLHHCRRQGISILDCGDIYKWC